MIIDVFLVIILLGIMVFEAKRGFGKAIFDFIALFVAVRLVPIVVPQLAKSFCFISESQANEALLFAGAFAVLAIALLFIGKKVYDATLITLDTFDHPLGGVLGIGVAIILGHVVMKLLAIAASTGGVLPDMLVKSSIGMEFYQFVTYHKVMALMSSLTA
ncbi:MAG: CvpA family protein [Armatimonadota bacterium]